jgi:hypothetical protein
MKDASLHRSIRHPEKKAPGRVSGEEWFFP